MPTIPCPKCNYMMMFTKPEEDCPCGKPHGSEVLICLRCKTKVVMDKRGFMKLYEREGTSSP